MVTDTTPTDTDPAEPADALGAGTVLNERYRIDARLGLGGYGEVLAATDTQADRRVALKILRADAAERDPAALARMRQEAEILRALDHPHIVGVWAIETCSAGEFIVMELLEGQRLDEVMETHAPADVERVAPVVAQLLDALSEAHSKYVLHRDIKPNNIMLVAADDDAEAGDHAKLVDFGIAKAEEPLDDNVDDAITLVKTRAGGFVGTPQYSAPEIVIGDPAGPSADLFSLGLVICEWLTGRPRISSDTYGAVMGELMNPEPFDVGDCPPDWRPWLARMIAKTPEQRYQSAAEALAAFERMRRGEPLLDESVAVDETAPLGDEVEATMAGAPAEAGGFRELELEPGDDLDLELDLPEPAHVAEPAPSRPTPVPNPSAPAPAEERTDPGFERPADRGRPTSLLTYVAVGLASCIAVFLLLVLLASLFEL